MRPLLIAECCQNHNGQRAVLQRMVHEAAAAGADYLKIQGLYSAEVTFRDRFEEGSTDPDGRALVIKRPHGPEVNRLAALDLSPDDEAWFVDECVEAGVKSMITVFTRAGLRRVEGMGFDAVKIASYDCKSFPLLREARRTWADIVVSTGATHDGEIERAAETLAGQPFTFLHCVTLYPTPLDQLHLRRMSYLRRFTSSVGYSDHTRPADSGLTASQAALAFGADVIERHFTVLDRAETRDGPVSVTAAELAELRSFADLERPERMARLKAEHADWRSFVGDSHRPLSDAELLNRDYYAGRVASKEHGRDVFNWEDGVWPGDDR